MMKNLFRALFVILFLFFAGYTISSIYSKNRPASDSSLSNAKSGFKRDRSGGPGVMGVESETAEVPGAGIPSSENSNRSGNDESLDLAQARRLLDQYKSEITDVIEHAEYAAELVAALCKNGRTREAWEFIEASSGQMRNMQLREFFKNADLNRNELVAWLSGLEYAQDLQRGLDGYFLRIRPSEYVNELSSPEIKALHDSLGVSISDVLRRAMNSLISDLYHRKNSPLHPPSEATVRELLDSITRMDAEGLIKPDEVRDMVRHSPFDAFTQWDLLKNHTTIPSSIIERMIWDNPAKAMNEIFTTQGARQSENVDIAVRAWLGADSGSLIDWYTKNQTNLDTQQQGLVASAFAKSALGGSDFDNAREWAGQIQDPRLKEETFRAIAEKEAGGG